MQGEVGKRESLQRVDTRGFQSPGPAILAPIRSNRHVKYERIGSGSDGQVEDDEAGMYGSVTIIAEGENLGSGRDGQSRASVERPGLSTVICACVPRLSSQLPSAVARFYSTVLRPSCQTAIILF